MPDTREKKPLSEAAQWFLRDFQRLLDDFAKETGAQIAVVNQGGNLVIEILGPQRVHKLIMASEEGRTRYRDAYKTALSLVRAQKKPIFVEDFAGYACVWVPILIRGKVIGLIVSCGGRYDKGESREKLIEKFSKLADELGVVNKEDFLKAAIDEVKIVTKEDVHKRAERLIKLIEILSETARTPLKEVFGQ